MDFSSHTKKLSRDDWVVMGWLVDGNGLVGCLIALGRIVRFGLIGFNWLC